MIYTKIYAIGDSHSGTFYSLTNSINMGPETMYNVSQWNHFIKQIDYLLDRKEIIRDAFWIFCFGEIDVRCHIHNQIIEKNREEDEVINSLAENYIRNVCKIHTHVGVMSVIPPAAIENKLDKVNHIINSQYNFIGSDLDRSRYAKKLNNKLEELCKKENILYLDTYSLHVDENGFLLEEYADQDQIHLCKGDRVLTLLNSIKIFENYR